LQATFPEIQFIVTTHSPQVLTTVPRECIRLLETQWDEDAHAWSLTSIEPDYQTLGVASAETLSRIMGIDPVPEVVEARMLHDYRRAIELGDDQSPEARSLHERLVAHFGEQHPEMLECERLRRFQAMKRRVKGRESSSDA
ncbi:MAG: hypothetical protein ACRC3F_18555, partial [Billgrantia desiderata]